MFSKVPNDLKMFLTYIWNDKQKIIFGSEKSFLIEISDISGPLQTSQNDDWELILAECCHFGAVYSYGNAFLGVLVILFETFGINLTQKQEGLIWNRIGDVERWFGGKRRLPPAVVEKKHAL